jgi:hypothetical protein
MNTINGAASRTTDPNRIKNDCEEKRDPDERQSPHLTDEEDHELDLPKTPDWTDTISLQLRQ